MSCNLKVLDRHEATVKALLYTSKDGLDEDLQSFVRAVTPWPKSLNLWINHAVCVELLCELEMHLGVGTVFVTEEMYNKFPTARKTSDDTIMLAEIFVQLFQQQGLGVRDSTVYRRRQGCRFTWEPWMSLDSWLNLFFDLRMPPAFLSKLRENVLWLQKEGATSKNMPRLDLFPRLHLMNYVEFTNCLYDFTLGQTLVTPALNTTICCASNTDCEFAACRPPYQLLGLLLVLTGWGRNESAKGRTLVSTLPSNSEELSSDERFAKACASNYLEKENRLLKVLCAIGGISHPRLNRKDNAALYLTGEPSTYKTFLARLVLDTVYGFDHIDIISRSRSRFNPSSLRKSDGSPYVLLMDDSRWGELGLALADFLNLLDPEEWARLVNERAKVFERHMPIAFNNLTVAQHQDMLRYTKTQFGTFAPKLQRFVAGDFVYLKRQKADSLDPRVGRLVLRVKSVGSGGRLVLEGRDRKLIRDHVENCAPCHLPNLDIWQNPKLARRDVDHGC
jgi:hypothetical protein